MNQFEKLKQNARRIPEMRNYLDSVSAQMGREIFKQRVNREMSQQALANLSHVTQTTISRVEAGDPGIKSETYDKVLKSLNTRLEIKLTPMNE